MFQDKEKISVNQAFMLVIAGGIGNIFLVYVNPAVKDAGRDGWLSVLIAYTMSTLLGLVLVNLGLRFPDKTFIQYLPVVLGKFIGKLIGLAYVLCWMVMNPIIIRDFMDLMRFFLPTTPQLLIGSLMYILVIYVAYKGFEVYARTAELFVVIVLFSILLLMIGISPNVDYGSLKPFLENGFSPVSKSLLVQFPFAAETILFMALWYPCMSQMKKGKKCVLIGVPIAGLVLVLLFITVIAFTGPAMAAELTSPVFYMVRYIHISDFISGFEALFMLLWVSSIYLELLVFFYQPLIGLAQWLNLKDYKPLIIPGAIINLMLSLIPANVVQASYLDTLKNPYIILPMAALIPLVWMVAVIRKLDESNK
ncbi:MAG TPA: spore gernimation protein [Clostridiaceae bacterium]|nr:spore gernimation protein [Clostridiaceae bacterium]